MRFERFSNTFQVALNDARSIALYKDNRFIEPMHVFLAFLTQETGFLYKLLKYLTVNIKDLIKSLDIACDNLLKIETIEKDVECSQDLIQILNLCNELSHKYSEHRISEKMFVLSSVKTPGNLQNLLKNFGITLDKIELLIKNRNQNNYQHNMLNSYNNILTQFTVDITRFAELGNLDPVIGRDEEIRRTIQVLQRRTKNNPVLIGKPGVGKTAIIEGLAQRIINDDIPEGLKNSRILSLNISTLLAGTKYRGEFENRFKQILTALSQKNSNIILFIDELHIIVGAGRINGAMDASNMIKPKLARGELHCVGATTLDEYNKYIETDAALERRFQKIFVNEPNIKDTIAILRGLKERYELHHNVYITDSAIVAASTLSSRYISDRQLPDKAIDLIDEAASSIRIQIDSKPENLERLEHRITQLKLEQKALEKESDDSSKKRLNSLTTELINLEQECSTLTLDWKNEKKSLSNIQNIKSHLEQSRIAIEQARRVANLEKMSELQYGKIPELEKKLSESLMMHKKKSKLLRNYVSEIEIAEVLSRWTGIPVSKMLTSEKYKLLHMEKIIHQLVIGQDDAIKIVSNAIRRNRAGLSDTTRPIGSFIFLGPTGVGKTELCKALSHFLFDTKNSMIRIDMSEFMERHSISKLLGAPPGYIGYETGGYLTEAVRHRPYSMILLDEIEKAHSDIFNILLQVLDDGRLTDGKGRTVNFSNTVIIMTSNLGSDLIQNKFDLVDYQKIKKIVLNVVNQYFRPEFINRVDEIVVFHPLNVQHIIDIARIQLQHLYCKLDKKGYPHTEITNSALLWLSKIGFHPLYGARPLKRVIQQYIENPLSKEIISDNLLPGKKITLDVKDDCIIFIQ